LVEQAVEITQDAKRPDLELKVLENHRNNKQTLSKGYEFDSGNLDQRIQKLKNMLHSS
jgi:hypothetical protein